MSVTGFNRRRRALAAQQRHTEQRLELTVELTPEIATAVSTGVHNAVMGSLGNNQKGVSLEEMTVKELRVLAKETGVAGYSNMSKVDLIAAIQETKNANATE